jgi:hypothetical protein
MMKRAGLLLTAVVITALSVAPAYADSDTKSVKGKFEEQAFTEGCTSPVDLCAAGRFTGGLHGPFEIVVTNATPTSDPDVLLLETSSVLHTKKGDIFLSGRTVLNTVTGAFSSVDTITGGTGKYAGATGTLHSTGTFNAETGVGVGEWQAVITTP